MSKIRSDTSEHARPWGVDKMCCQVHVVSWAACRHRSGMLSCSCVRSNGMSHAGVLQQDCADSLLPVGRSVQLHDRLTGAIAAGCGVCWSEALQRWVGSCRTDAGNGVCSSQSHSSWLAGTVCGLMVCLLAQVLNTRPYCAIHFLLRCSLRLHVAMLSISKHALVGRVAPS
jgi:hypothetical protein